MGLAEWAIIRTLLALFDLAAAEQRPSKSHSVSHIVVILNIAKGTTDPWVDYFNQLLWFGELSLVSLVNSLNLQQVR